MRIALVVVILIWASLAYAHDSPENRVRQLTFEMARGGDSPALLMQRGIEYSAMGETENAALDFEHVLKLDDRAVDAFKALAGIRLEQGNFTAALLAINRGISLTAESDCPVLFATRARIQAASSHDMEALADFERAFACGDPELEWFLQRAEIQNRLALYEECIAGLREGVRQTGSAVLEEELIESLIDGGLCSEALKRIEPELKAARMKSAWLLRRARARIGLGKSARKDLAAALKELDARINDRAPDVSLLVERGIVFALLDRKKAAERDLARAKEQRADSAILWRLERAVHLPSKLKQ